MEKIIKKFGDYSQITEKKDEKPKAKFKKGDKVKYLPKLSGLDPNFEFTISNSEWEEKDELSLVFGVASEPTWVYSLAEMPMQAIESDLK